MKLFALFAALALFNLGHALTANGPVSCPLGSGPVTNYDFQELLASLLEALVDFISAFYNQTCSVDTLQDVTSRLLDAILQFIVALLSLFSAYYKNITTNPVFYNFILGLVKTAATIGSQSSGNTPFNIDNLANVFADVLSSTSGVSTTTGNSNVIGGQSISDTTISNAGSSGTIINNAGSSSIVTSNAASSITTAGSSSITTGVAGGNAGASDTVFNVGNPGYFAANPLWYPYPVLPAAGTSDISGPATGSISAVSAGSAANSAAVSSSNSQSGSVIGTGSNYNGPLAPLSFYDLALQSLQQAGGSNIPAVGFPQLQLYPQLPNGFVNNMQGSSTPNINPLTQQAIGVSTSSVSSYPQAPVYPVSRNTFPVLNTGGASGGAATSGVTASSGSGTSGYTYPSNLPQRNNLQFGQSYGG